ncbi:MAG: citramalate synthase [Deltaproteobacteria bacterium]|nr:citramalate synthase [Deltaproteobacteria bacterium]
MTSVALYDTTLRDGTQKEGLDLSVADKLHLAERLEQIGMTFVEGGFPGSNPKDARFFAEARERAFAAALTAFGSTARPGVPAADDLQLRSLVEAGTGVVTIFGKTAKSHVERVLRTAPEENLDRITESVAFLVGKGKRVIYDAEHFFDGYFEDRDYALACLAAAAEGGAEVLVLCDTNGGRMPWEIEEGVRAALEHGEVGVHLHDDGGCAVASSLQAVRAGATHVQGTLLGWGERCGNADLVAIAANLELKMDLPVLAEGGLAGLRDLARFAAELAGLRVPSGHPYVGRSAFAHKGGVHVSAIRRFPRAYEHVDPRAVGNRTRVVVSELSGRSNILAKAEELGLDAEGSEREVLELIKRREANGYAYEAAEASVALMLERRKEDHQPSFEVIDHHVSAGRRGDADGYAEATVKVTIEGETRHTAGEGCGPVAALDAALRKALLPARPELKDVRLSDYKVRIVDTHDGTDATTRVLIECARGTRRWRTVGASRNVVAASLEALVDGYEFGLRFTSSPGAGTQPLSPRRGLVDSPELPRQKRCRAQGADAAKRSKK